MRLHGFRSKTGATNMVCVKRPRIGITVGDPAGIGPEIVLKALAAKDRPDADYIVFGAVDALADRMFRFGLPAAQDTGARVVDIPAPEEIALGTVSAGSGHAAARAVLRAVQEIRRGRLDAIVTAPLQKEALSAAGYPWPGHTELLAEAAGTPDVAMMFVGGGLKVALLTIHRALRSVPDAITGDEVKRVVRLVARELPRFGAAAGRIALCGLNPHAGEGGLFGTEEREVLSPALATLRAEGLDVHGPFPADTLFVRAARGDFDAVIACYHDQGLIPVKLASFGKAVNVTIGLPFVRTSVDHGTGFDIVTKGTADAGSLLEAMTLAAALARPAEGA
jgi:4-hydroxythreonine-4-phosphate dehydrogenase